MSRKAAGGFSQSHFQRRDERDDALFYRIPRGEPCLNGADAQTFSELVHRLIEPGQVILDLMASAHSYLPPALQPNRLIGVGMSAQDMARNPQLTSRLVHDLNRLPQLPFDENSFDAILCTCGVQYLIHPVELFGEANRVLRPGRVFLVTFTGSCYPEKAIAIWRATRARQHQLLVSDYFQASGGWEKVHHLPEIQPPGVPEKEGMHAVWARKKVT